MRSKISTFFSITTFLIALALFASMTEASSSKGNSSSSSSSEWPVIEIQTDTMPKINDRVEITDYNRNDWIHWSDLDHDCQTSRAEILIKQSVNPKEIVYTDAYKKCAVRSGKWIDPYSGKTYTDASKLDIDHIVPLKWAHEHGAASWSKAQKKLFANDLNNLNAVYYSLNRSKIDKGPTEWMPPEQKYRCTYINSFNNIVISYKLTYTTSEYRIIKRMLSACNNIK